MKIEQYKGLFIYPRSKNNYEVRAGFFGDKNFKSKLKAKEWIKSII